MAIFKIRCSDGIKRYLKVNTKTSFESSFDGNFEAATALLEMMLTETPENGKVNGIIYGILLHNSFIVRLNKGTGLWSVDTEDHDPIPQYSEILEWEGTAASVLREKAKLILKEVYEFRHIYDNPEAQELVVAVIGKQRYLELYV